MVQIITVTKYTKGPFGGLLYCDFGRTGSSLIEPYRFSTPLPFSYRLRLENKGKGLRFLHASETVHLLSLT